MILQDWKVTILTEIWTCLCPALRRYKPILLGSSVKDSQTQHKMHNIIIISQTWNNAGQQFSLQGLVCGVAGGCIQGPMCLQLSFRCQVILLCFLLLGSFHCSSTVDGFKVEMYHMVQYCNIKSYISKPNIFTKAAKLLYTIPRYYSKECRARWKFCPVILW